MASVALSARGGGGGWLIAGEDGHLTLLDDPDIREAAAAYGDPDDVLAPVSHAGPDAAAGWG